VFQHEDGVLLSIFELLEEEQGLFVVAETPFNAVALKDSNVSGKTGLEVKTYRQTRNK